MSALYDLHCHSNISDGLLSPREVVERAAVRGVTTLALTDHDTVEGVASAQQAAMEQGVTLVPGVELSVMWQQRTFHVVGLGVDIANENLLNGLECMQRARYARGIAMGERLERAGLRGALEGARELAGEAQITRAHYARWMVETGCVRGYEEAFKRYLRRGRIAYVHGDWVGLEEGVKWLSDAGGVAVLAHPLGYDLTGAWLRRVIDAFVAAGGRGIEVSCGSSPLPRQVEQLSGWCRRFGLLASVGSDFHAPGYGARELGGAPEPPADLPFIGQELR